MGKAFHGSTVGWAGLVSTFPPHLEMVEDGELPIREAFQPSYFSKKRNGSVTSSIFSLVSTILGGGILTLPYAFSEAGIIPCSCLLISVAVASDFSAFTLAVCCRQGAAHTYEDVAALAFGESGRTLSRILVVLLTFLALVAYSILLREIIASFIGSSNHFLTAIIVGGLEIFILPLAMLTSFRSLRFTSVLCFCSVLVVACCVAVQLSSCMARPKHSLHTSLLWPHDIIGIFRALPVLICTFLCHFNVLAIQSELEDPSRERVEQMVHGAVGMACLMYFFIGLSGDMYSDCEKCDTEDNILSEISPEHLFDKVFLTIAKCMIACTLLFALPMIASPCRDTLVRLWNAPAEVSAQAPRQAHQKYQHVPGEINSNPLLEASLRVEDDEHTSFDTPRDCSRDSTLSSLGANSNKRMGIITLATVTAAIFAVQFAVAMSIKSVSTVWAFIGSLVGPVIAFVIPSASYLVMTSPTSKQAQNAPRRFGSIALLMFSGLTMCICTSITLYDLIVG